MSFRVTECQKPKTHILTNWKIVAKTAKKLAQKLRSILVKNRQTPPTKPTQTDNAKTTIDWFSANWLILRQRPHFWSKIAKNRRSNYLDFIFHPPEQGPFSACQKPKNTHLGQSFYSSGSTQFSESKQRISPPFGEKRSTNSGFGAPAGGKIGSKTTFFDFFQQKFCRYKNYLYICTTKNDGAIAQLVEQRTENPCVPGSIPGGTTAKKSKTT